jgi:hypothetical protein
MTATQLPVRSRPAAFRPPSAVPAWRLFRLELRRNPMPWTFPLLAALFAFDPFRTAMSYPAVWDVRASVLLNKMVPDFVVFVAGIAAWVGSRDGRRHTLELVEMTTRGPGGPGSSRPGPPPPAGRSSASWPGWPCCMG